MSNLTRYGYIRDEQDGVCFCQMAVREHGEYVKFDDIKEFLPTDKQQPQLEMPCESDFMAWCGINQYNQSHAASIYRYIARHIKQVR